MILSADVRRSEEKRLKTFAFDFESIIWAQKLGYSIIEMPVKIINHRASTVHIFRDTFRMLSDLIKIRRRVGKESKKIKKKGSK